jgi:hypothetical protein
MNNNFNKNTILFIYFYQQLIKKYDFILKLINLLFIKSLLYNDNKRLIYN